MIPAAGGIPIDRVEASAYVVPTESRESDGTLAWDATTLVLVEITGGGRTGLGYTYADSAAARLIRESLAEVATGHAGLGIGAIWTALRHAVRNLGVTGIAAMAIAAIDVALWDLVARQQDRPLVAVLGATRSVVPAYGSGGFTSYDRRRRRPARRSDRPS